MAIRTTSSYVTFKAPFRLAEMDETHAPGTFLVETDEDIIEGNERTVYVRTATMIHLRHEGGSQVLTVDPDALDQAVERDRKLRVSTEHRA